MAASGIGSLGDQGVDDDGRFVVDGPDVLMSIRMVRVSLSAILRDSMAQTASVAISARGVVIATDRALVCVMTRWIASSGAIAPTGSGAGIVFGACGLFILSCMVALQSLSGTVSNGRD